MTYDHPFVPGPRDVERCFTCGEKHPPAAPPEREPPDCDRFVVPWDEQQGFDAEAQRQVPCHRCGKLWAGHQREPERRIGGLTREEWGRWYVRHVQLDNGELAMTGMFGHLLAAAFAPKEER